MVSYIMANYRKTRNLKRELGELDRLEKDYMENLANSLLKIQTADFRYLAEHGADPNSESEEGGTPLGNQCYANGKPEIVKGIIDAGADPNKESHVEAGNYLSPLFMVLLPGKYNEETHTFKPLAQSQVERAKLLVAAGANVNEKREAGETPLGLALTFAESAQRRELFTLLRDKGANLDDALKGMEKLAEQGYGEYGFALYLYYADWMRDVEHLPIPKPSNEQWEKDFETAKRFLEQSAKTGYEPAKDAISPHQYIPCRDDR